jgi:nucleotide-binding universal stress UspA family protein
MPIICGTDLSAASAGALEVARALATQRGESEVVLVYVIDDEDAAITARTKLEALITSAGPGPTIRGELVVGAADTTLVSFADTEGSDLIVIAASSHPGSLLRLGSTAEKVIATTRVPVIVVRDPAPLLKFARGERTLRLLLGVDDSVACDVGIQWVHALRTRGPVEVELGAIYYPDDAAHHYGLHAKMVVDRDPEIERLLSRDLLRRFGETERVEALPRRGLGRIGDHLIELANETSVDAIVVGTGQKTGLERLGSVSSVIVHDARQSVICIPPSAIVPTMRVPTISNVLVATDLSPFANRAVPWAYAIGSEIHLAHVVEDDTEIDEADLRRQLIALAPQGKSLEPHVVRGDDAAEAIAQTAARLGCDAICIASHGRSGISRALVGSIADKLIRATRKPVLVLRPG